MTNSTEWNERVRAAAKSHPSGPYTILDNDSSIKGPMRRVGSVLISMVEQFEHFGKPLPHEEFDHFNVVMFEDGVAASIYLNPKFDSVRLPRKTPGAHQFWHSVSGTDLKALDYLRDVLPVECVVTSDVAKFNDERMARMLSIMKQPV